MIPQTRPYRPVLYQPDGYARFRQYPRQVRTPIPGAGYDASQLRWSEQELDLRGGSSPNQYGYGGHYGTVPLRGLGRTLLSPEASKPMYTLTPQKVAELKDEPSSDEEGGPVLPQDASKSDEGVPKVLLWSGIGIGVLAVGGAVLWFRRQQ